jgi:hypothetical protein
LFLDGQPAGTVHTIEWQTSTPILFNGFGIAAFHEAPTNVQRAFRQFRLESRPIGGGYQAVYDSPVVVPYAPASRDLVHCVNLRPHLAQQFRASFTQEAAAAFSGPRVLELDARVLPDQLLADGFEP